ncbi:MAG: hypothetical protein R3A52_07880 [Polyangiales bacterium]
MSTERTAWHPPFTTLLRERAPAWAKVTGEPQLTQEPLRPDDLIELRVDVPRDPSDVGEVLRGLWPLVRVVALLEFKSVSRPFRRGDLARLLAYGLVWFYTRQTADALTAPTADGGVERRRAETADLTLALVVPTMSPTLTRELAQMRLALTTTGDGYRRAEALVVIELNARRSASTTSSWPSSVVDARPLGREKSRGGWARIRAGEAPWTRHPRRWRGTTTGSSD